MSKSNHDAANTGNKTDILPWKEYTVIILGIWIAFSLATFSMAVYFTHLEGSILLVDVALIAIYIVVIVLCIRRLIQTLSIAALFLLVPIAPLSVLLLVLALLPIVQMLR